MIKVCHMTSAHDSDDVRIFQKECVSIASYNEYKVYLIAPGVSRVEKNVKIVGLGDKPTSRLKRMFFFTKKVYREALKYNAEIYHFHDPELLLVGLKLKKKGKCVVFDSHENTYDQIKIKTYIPRIIRDALAKIYLYLETYICKKIDAVIFPCLVNGLNPFENRARKTVFVNNVPFLSEFSNYKKGKTIYDVCHIGSLSKERGITNMVKACIETGSKLVIGGEFASDEYEAYIRKLAAHKEILLAGTCSRSEVVKYYSKSEIGISTILNVGQYASIWNLPTKVYEFMAMKMPVIISDFPYTKELLNEYKFGIAVNPKNLDEIISAINLLKQDDNLRNVMGEEGFRAIHERFNWEVEHKNIIDLYRSFFDE